MIALASTRSLPRLTGTPLERIMQRTDRTGECWLWRGRLNKDGYAEHKLHGRTHMAHRTTYESLVGPIPDGMQLDHRCRVRHCVNPAHLEPVTSRENTLRGVGLAKQNADKTHCPQGHPYDEANTYRYKNYRRCKTCLRERARAYRAAKRGGS
ncbi:HNH endonuclease signature motif containing protein [Streptomyces sp. ALI-76-A]|uniref:HNH endonuclease signature motif containing protein n=1 Tax=Streptomyces sp. ALI-76-A TaxID=3025736 RepID=UPI00256ED6E5|nr:HNH endonuclease signature motif containing protein [Streptomyces sp. ALI-76-A]MDL5205070.1 HNH endonuclease signature motif containing protein [Streptomyces sp. ALI-76-A]